MRNGIITINSLTEYIFEMYTDNTDEKKKSYPDDTEKIILFGRKIDKRIPIFIFLFLFICIFLWQDYNYIVSDQGFSDDDRHFERFIEYYDDIILGQKHRLESIQYPPFVYITAQPFMYFMGAKTKSVRLGLLIFSIIFIISMYGIGYELGDEYSGIAVMCLASSSPFVIFFSRRLLLDFPQTAMSALAFYMLLKTGLFKNRKYSLLLGLTFSLSILTKWSTLFFMAVPVILFIIPSIIKSIRAFLSSLIFAGFSIPMIIGITWYYGRNAHSQSSFHWFLYYILIIALPLLICFITLFFIEKKWKKEGGYRETGEYRVINFILMSIITILATAPWFFWAGVEIKNRFITETRFPRFPAENFDMLIFSMKNMFNLSIPLLLVGIIFIILLRKNKEKLYSLIAITITLILNLLIMIIIGHPQTRYIFSLVIMVSAISGYWISSVKKFRFPLTIIIVLLSLIVIICPAIAPKSIIESGKFEVDYIHLWKTRIIIPKTTTKTFYDISSAINWAFPDRLIPQKIAVFRKKDPPFVGENIITIMLEQERRLDNFYKYDFDHYPILDNEAKNFQSYNNSGIRAVDAIFLVHKDSGNIACFRDFIRSRLPAEDFEMKTFSIKSEWSITVFRAR